MTISAWKVPLASISDSLGLLAGEKAVAEGYFPFVRLKFNPHLGAPYSANWNDWPTTEEILIILPGILSKFVGIFAAANLAVLIAQVLAGVTFYVVCRYLRYRWPWAFLGGLTFAMSHYAFQRGLPHISLTYYWHLPLCLLVVRWCTSRGGLALWSKRFWFAVGTAVITSFQNPYYTNIFLQFLGFSAVIQIFRRSGWRIVLPPLLIGTVAVAGFILMNLDTIYYQKAHGKNLVPSYRSYQNLEIYALKPIDLLIPNPDHRSSLGRAFAARYLYDETSKTGMRGEVFYSYLGIAGIAAMIWLSLVTLSSLSGGRMLPVHSLEISWVIFYSVVGGVNGIFGQLGLTAFRCANRYSIYILAIALLFAVQRLSKVSRNWHSLAVCACSLCAIPVILWDQLPPAENDASIARAAAPLAADRAFTHAMEHALPRDAMVFQVPVMKFPESWPINQMGDYEHFRPYLYSSHLHFSYGSDKGRGDDDWQTAAERQPPAQMAKMVEAAGFGAIYINRRGFADNGSALVTGLEEAGYHTIIDSPAHDLACVVLHASQAPTLPETPPQFTSGWYGEEGDGKAETWHCSSGDAEIILHNDTKIEQTLDVSFQLTSPSPRTVQLFVGDQPIYRSPTLTPEKLPHFFKAHLPPGATKFHFKTEPPVTFPGNPDTRLLGFVLYNFRATTAATLSR